ncbi:transglycosylase SLT domain-containing protein [Nocardia wallacei]|uniref:transglycosylase SLT domain-containing protein n=1 Tax=Nocardia wallacei TaxID=480035 RepID=UPI0024541A82|nr:transglycosylase SLT domain-containing protein [Nocardia wallacei]
MPSFTAGSAEVTISPDFSNFVRELRTYLERVDAEVSVELDLNTALAEQRIEDLSRDRRVELEVDLDDAGTEARLDELARDRTVRLDVDVDNASLAAAAGNLQRVGAGADSAHRSLSLMSAVRFGGLTAGLASLIPVLGGLAAAAGGMAAVFGGLAGAGAVGGSGVLDAFQAMRAGSEGAGQAAQQHAADLDQLADAQQRVIDAQHNEQESLQRVEDAQKSLTDARKDAKDTIDDLNLAVKDGALSERGAELAYRRAVVNLEQTRTRAAQGRASSLDVEEAQLSVDRAGQNITDVRVRNQQTQRKADEANAGGVEGSEQVQAAQRNLDQARYSAQRAGVETAKAVRELARAQEEAAKSADAASGGTDKLAEAMAKLSPNAREFVLAMQALGPQWTELRKAVQDNLFAGLGESVTQLANNQLPALRDGLGQIATGLNGAIRQTLGSLDQLFTQLTQSGAMQAFIDGVNQALQGMAPFVTGLVDAFIQLGAEIGPHLGPLFAALGTAASQLAGPLGQLGGAFADSLVDIMPALTQFVGALAEGLTPVLPVIGRLLNAVGSALTPLIGPLSQIAQTLGNALADAINAIAPHLPTIAQAFADLFRAVAPLVKPLADIIGTIAGAVAQNISALANALAPVVSAFADGLAPVAPILADAFKQMAPEFAKMADTLGKALLDALQQVTPILPDLVQAMTNLFIAVAPLLPELFRMGAEILPILADILVRVAPLVLELLRNFTDFVNFVVPILIPALQSLADYTRTSWDVIRSVWDAMSSALGRLRDLFRDVIEEVTQRWGDLVTAIQSPFTAPGSVAVGVLGSMWNTLTGNAEGGLISGPGTGTSDSIVARLSNGEYVVNAAQTARYLPVLQAINGGALPGYAEGGQVQNKQMKQGGQSPTVASMAQAVGARFPGMTLTSGVRSTADYHGQGKAADFSNGSDSTPEMRSLADWIATNYPNSLELIHSPFNRNIKNGKVVGDGLATYGAATMQQHRNHVHWAVSGPVTAPQAKTAPSTAAVPGNPASPTGTYTGPSSVDTSKDVQEAQQKQDDQKPPEFSVPGLLSYGGEQLGNALFGPQQKITDSLGNELPQAYTPSGVLGTAGSILGDGLLSALGLEGSILSPSNRYNRGINTAVQFYAEQDRKQQQATTADAGASTTPPATDAPAAPAQQSAPPQKQTPTKHTYNPGGGAEQWRGTVLTVLNGTGRPASLADRTIAQIRIESGGDPNAQNNWDVNARNGNPSIGLLQVIKTTFDANVDKRFPGTQRDPEANIAAALNYVDKRYKGAQNIWPKVNGYASGGLVQGAGTGTSDSVPIWASDGEFVVNAAATAANGDWLRAINAGTARLAPAPAGIPRAATTSTVNRDHSVQFNAPVSVMDMDHLVREQDRWAALQAQGTLAAY